MAVDGGALLCYMTAIHIGVFLQMILLHFCLYWTSNSKSDRKYGVRDGNGNFLSFYISITMVFRIAKAILSVHKAKEALQRPSAICI